MHVAAMIHCQLRCGAMVFFSFFLTTPLVVWAWLLCLPRIRGPPQLIDFGVHAAVRLPCLTSTGPFSGGLAAVLLQLAPPLCPLSVLPCPFAAETPVAQDPHWRRINRTGTLLSLPPFSFTHMAVFFFANHFSPPPPPLPGTTLELCSSCTSLACNSWCQHFEQQSALSCIRARPAQRKVSCHSGQVVHSAAAAHKLARLLPPLPLPAAGGATAGGLLPPLPLSLRLALLLRGLLGLRLADKGGPLPAVTNRGSRGGWPNG